MKKLRMILLAVLLLLTSSACRKAPDLQVDNPAEQEHDQIVHTSGDWEYLLLTDGTALISEYGGEAEAVTIPAEIDGYTVTSIDGLTFAYCQSLTSVIIPDSVTSVGRMAFFCCPSLTSVTLPTSLTSIGTYAFNNCYYLKSVTLPASLTTIGWNAFGSCPNLTLTIPRDTWMAKWYDDNDLTYTCSDSSLDWLTE